MNVDFHVHTNRSIDAIHSPRAMVKMAKKSGLDAIAITDHNRLFPAAEAKRLSTEFDIVIIPGIEGGNIAVRKHWIAIGISRHVAGIHIREILASIRNDNGISIAPHPHTRLGYDNYADYGFDAVESLNGSEPVCNRRVRNLHNIPEVAGSDAHALQMLGFCWTEVDADRSAESILESVRSGRCQPAGTTIPLSRLISFYPLFLRDRVLFEPIAAFRAACNVIQEIRRVRAVESSCRNCRTYQYPR
jgi:predicted metal-dependent phosphoesterase TrpH